MNPHNSPSAPPQQQGHYAPPQQNYPPQQGYPLQQQNYPPQQNGHSPQQYPQQTYPQQGYPPQNGYSPQYSPQHSPQQPNYPPQQGYPPQQQYYPPQQGYPPQQQNYPPQQTGYSPQHSPQGSYSPQIQGTYTTSATVVQHSPSPTTQKTGFLSSLTNVLNTVKPGGAGKITLYLDKPSYLAGEIVTGRAELLVTDNIVAKSLMIKWKGFERTKLSHTETYHHNGNTHTRVVWHHEEKDFFKQVTPLCNYGGQTVVPGSYTYNFQYQLPQNLPGVFSIRGGGYMAAIMYKLKVWVDMQGFDIKSNHFITVNENLNRQPQLVHAQNEKTFLFGGSGKLKLFVDIPKDIFAPGEQTVVKVNVTNDSKKDVSKHKVKLMQDVEIRCRGRRERVCREIHRQEYEGCKSRTTLQKDFIFNIPSNVFPSTNAHLISNQYHLDIECDVAMAFDLEVKPKISVAIPNGYNNFNMYADFQKGCWK